jgi:hypothetical protein
MDDLELFSFSTLRLAMWVCLFGITAFWLGRMSVIDELCYPIIAATKRPVLSERDKPHG